MSRVSLKNLEVQAEVSVTIAHKARGNGEAVQCMHGGWGGEIIPHEYVLPGLHAIE